MKSEKIKACPLQLEDYALLMAAVEFRYVLALAGLKTGWRQ